MGQQGHTSTLSYYQIQIRCESSFLFETIGRVDRVVLLTFRHNPYKEVQKFALLLLPRFCVDYQLLLNDFICIMLKHVYIVQVQTSYFEYVPVPFMN